MEETEQDDRKGRPSPTGRPTLFDKDLKRTFMVSSEADALLARMAAHWKCSRSDVLEYTVRSAAPFVLESFFPRPSKSKPKP